MSNCEFFANNFKLLRTSYHLSMSELAFILNFKNKSTIAQLEATKIFPSFETLIQISNLFAVNIDWLVGRSSHPYSEEVILYLEKQIMDIKINSITSYGDSLPDEYSDIEKRSEFYSLAERANLIFLLQYMKLLIDKYPELLSTSTNENITDHLLDHLNLKKSRFNDPEEKYLYLLRAIGSILLNDIRKSLPLSSKPHIIPEPLFDITKLP